MYCVYVLKSLKNDTYYKGMTTNLDKRLGEHFDGRCSSTKKIRPLKLIHVEICSNRVEARRYEKYLKFGYGREIIQEIADSM